MANTFTSLSCIYIYMCVCLDICMYLYAHIYICIYIHVCMCTHTHIICSGSDNVIPDNNITSITWELRHANSWAPPQTNWIRVSESCAWPSAHEQALQRILIDDKVWEEPLYHIVKSFIHIKIFSTILLVPEVSLDCRFFCTIDTEVIID